MRQPDHVEMDSVEVASREVAVKAVRGSLWAAFGAYSTFLVNFATVTVLARLVGPTAFGEFSLAQSYVEILFAFGAFAFGQAVIQAPAALPAAADTGLRLILLVRAALLALALPIAVIAARTSTAAVGVFVALLAAGGMLEALRNGMAAALERELRYGRMMIMSVIATVVGSATAIALAAAGLGARSLVAREILISVAGLAGLLVMRKRWRLPRGDQYDSETARYLWRFARGLYWVRASQQVFIRLDRLLLGNLTGLGELGLYHQAKYLASLPVSVIAPANQQVAIVTFSRLRDDPRRLGDAFDTVQYFVARSMVLAAVVTALFPEAVIGIVLGPRWLDAGPSLRILGLFLLVTPLLETYRSLHTALEHWRLLRLSVVAQAVALVAGLALFVPRHGAPGAALALGLSALTGVAAQLPGTARHLGRNRTGQIGMAVIAGLVALGAGAAARAVLGSGPARSALGIVVTSIAYGAGLLVGEGRECRARLARLRAFALQRSAAR